MSGQKLGHLANFDKYLGIFASACWKFVRIKSWWYLGYVRILVMSVNICLHFRDAFIASTAWNFVTMFGLMRSNWRKIDRFEKHTEHSRRMFPESFPYTPYAPRILPKYFHNTHGRHIRMIRKVDENYFEHAQQIVVATECRSVCIRSEPNSQYAPRTHRMLPEYDTLYLPEHPNSYSESKRNGIRSSVIGP